ncbi:MAG: DUF177 domain-containing protein [Ruminococcus sp.]|nr:DUF177 domain-containing protein [Ruminococcus sp.]
MILQLRQLFELEGYSFDINESIPLDELNESQPYQAFASPVEISGKASNRAGIVTLNITVNAVMSHVCDRCLEAFDRQYSYDFSHTLTRALANEQDEDNDEYVVCPNNTLDISELALSDLLLALPTKILCKEDCEGLCPICGANLNKGSCGCNED